MVKKSLLLIGLMGVLNASVAKEPNPLQGSWEWVNIKNSCVEVYTFGIKNTAHISSGEEISDARYTISDTPTAKGFYKVTLEILDDKGGQDCGESVENNTGEIYKKFVSFHPGGNHYVSCDKEDASTCVGPFKRLN